MQQSTLPAQVGPVTTRTRCRDHHQQCSSPCFQHRLDLSPLVQDAGSTNNAAVHASSTGWTCHRSYKMQGAPTMQRSTLTAQVGHVTTRTRYRDHQQCSSPRFQHRLDLSPLVQDAGTTNNAAVHTSSTGWTCHRSYKMQGPPTMQQSTLPAQVGPVTARTRCRDHQQCSGPRFQHRLDLSPLVQDVGTTNNAAVHASSTGWTCHHSYKMQGAPTMQQSTLPAQVGPVTTRTRCRDHQQCSSPRFQHRLDLSLLVQDAGTTNNAAVHASSTSWTCHHSYKMQGAPTMQQSTLPAQVGPVTTRTRCREHQQCSSPRFQHRLDLSPLVQDVGTTNNAAVHASSTGWTCHHSYKMQGPPTMQQQSTLSPLQLPAQVGPVTTRTRCREHQQCSSPRFQHKLDLSPLVQDAGTTNNAAVHASSTGWTCHHSYKMQGAPTMQRSTLPAHVGPVTARTRCRDHQQCSSPRFQHKLDLSPLVQDAGTTNNAQSTLPVQVGPVTARTRCREHQQCSSPRFQHKLDLSPLVQDAGTTNNAAVQMHSWTCHHSYKMQQVGPVTTRTRCRESTLPAHVGPVTARTRCRDHQQCTVHASSTSWTCHRSYKMQGPPTMQQSTLPAQVGPVTARTRCREHQQCSSPRFQHRLDLSPLVQDAGTTNNAAVHTSSTGWTCHHSYKMQGPPTMQSTLPAQVGPVTARTRCREHQQCSGPRFQHRLDLSPLVQDAGTTNNAAVHASSTGWTCHHSYKMQGPPTMQQSTLPAQVGPVTTRTRCRDHQQCSSPRFQHRLDLSPLVQDAGTTNNAAVHASSTDHQQFRLSNNVYFLPVAGVQSVKKWGTPPGQFFLGTSNFSEVGWTCQVARTRCRDHQQCSSPRFQHRLDLSPLIQDVGTTNNAAVHASSTGWTCHRSYKMQGPPTIQQSTLPAQVGPVTARTRCREHQQCSSPRFQHRLDLSPLVQDAGTTNNAAVHASSTGWTCGPVTARTRCRDHQQCSSPRFQHRLDLSPLVQDAGTTNNAAVHASSTGWTCHRSYKMQGAPTMQQSTLPAQVGPVTARTRCRDHQQCSSPRFQHRLDLSPLVQDAGTTNNAAVHASSTGWTCHRSYKM